MAVRKSTTPRPTRTLTPDFDGSPYRVAYDRPERSYVVVSADDVEGLHHGYTGGDPAGYTRAYELAAALNLEHAADVTDSRAALAEQRADQPRYQIHNDQWHAVVWDNHTSQSVWRGEKGDADAALARIRAELWRARQERMREIAQGLGLLSPAPLHPDPAMDTALYAALWEARSASLGLIAVALRGEATP